MQVGPGEAFGYVVTVVNEGNQDAAAGGDLTVELDPLTGVVDLPAGWECEESDCRYGLPSLAAGAAALEIELPVRVAELVEDVTAALRATATVVAAGDLDPTNNQDEEATPLVVPETPLTNVALELFAVDGGGASRLVAVRATVRNTTVHPAPEVSLRLELDAPPDLVTIATDAGHWSCDEDLVCFYAVGEVAAGESVYVDLAFETAVPRLTVHGLVATPVEEVTLDDNQDSVVVEGGTGAVHEIPTLAGVGLLVLGAGLGFLAAKRLRRRMGGR